jgi:hypothetical protein
LADVALAVKNAAKTASPEPLLIFDDTTGRVIDIDLRGSDAEIVERLPPPPRTFEGHDAPQSGGARAPANAQGPAPKGRGRPKLGVVAREVTLLPRQWEWLAEQPGGASAVLRRLVDDARRDVNSGRNRRAAQAAAYQFMLGIAGDLPGYEEASRALFAHDRRRLEQQIADWPDDIRSHIIRLAFASHPESG